MCKTDLHVLKSTHPSVKTFKMNAACHFSQWIVLEVCFKCPGNFGTLAVLTHLYVSMHFPAPLMYTIYMITYSTLQHPTELLLSFCLTELMHN